MKKLIPILTVLILIGCTTPEPQKFEIHRGVNISHWLSQSKKRGAERESYIQESDFKAIAAAGFDHVRIPMDEMQLWDEEGKRHEEAFGLLHQGIEWALASNLRVICDLHILRSHHFVGDSRPLWTDKNAQEKFYGFWEQLSDELNEYPNHLLAYELLNEAVADDAEDWNTLIENAIQHIRAKEKERIIVVGSNKWQQVFTFPELKIPANDKNLMLSFHYYDPFMVTHYRTSWNGAMGQYDGPIHYPGYPVAEADLNKFNDDVQTAVSNMNHEFTLAKMIDDIGIAKAVADSLGLPLYCGEFGIFKSVPMEVKKKLYADWMRAFAHYGIPWSTWDYKGSFAVFDAETQTPIVEITDILLNPDLQ